MAGIELIFDRGSPVIVEVEFRRKLPFGVYELFNPISTPLAEILDSEGSAKLLGQVMIQAGLGKWYLVFQTDSTWRKGSYTVRVTATDGVFSDVTVFPARFKLV